MSRTPQRPVLALLGWFAVCFAVAAVGAVASASAGEFYASLQRPTWAPPAALFGPVWTVLYAMMAVSAWLVWRKGGWRRQRAALLLFLGQLVLNGLWSWLFFGWRLGGLGFADILLLIGLLLATLAAFWHASRAAALLLVPYLVWICFAAALNWSVWQANPAILG